MKPTKLVMAAFGPYLNKTVIDFTRLGENGIYLITGDTGAGKTMIFEAISYALYGRTVSDTAQGKNKVSGRTAAMLRNKSAADDNETFVELDFISHGKHYHIRRSPRYPLERMKKSRKNAEQKQDEHSPSYELHCLEDGTLITKESEGDEKIVEIIGINRENFRKICMIAQGEFMSVIRENTEGRERILNEVFNTTPFGELSELLATKARAAENDLRELCIEIRKSIDNLSCESDSEFFPIIEAGKAVEIVSSEQIRRIVDAVQQLLQEDQDKVEKIKTNAAELNKVLDHLKKKLTQAETAQGLQQRLAALEAARADKQAQLPDLQKAFESLQDSPVQAQKLHSQAEVTLSKLGEYDELETVSAKLVQLKHSHEEAAGQVSHKKQQIRTAEESISALQERLKALEGIEERAAALSAEYDKLVTEGSRDKVFLDRFSKLDELIEQSEKQLKYFSTVKGQFDHLNAEYSRIHSEFLCDQAGILSAELKEGLPCPVCGSVSHPSPARPANSSVTKEQLDKARDQKERAEVVCTQASIDSRTAKNQAEDFRQNLIDDILIALGDNAPEESQLRPFLQNRVQKLRQQAIEVHRQKKAADLAKQEKTEKTRQLTEQQLQLKHLNDQLLEVTQQESRLLTEQNASAAQVQTLQEKLPFPSKNAAQDQIRHLQQQAEQLKKQFELAKNALTECQAEIEKLTASGETLKHELNGMEKLDLHEIKNEIQKRKDDYTTCSQQLVEQSTRIRINSDIVRRLESDIGRFEKASEHRNRCSDLARTANGNLPGKAKINFLSYVLAKHFDRVLYKANLRFAGMTDRRFALLRAEDTDDNRKRIGLGINVLDTVSHKTRRVETLSGGESFMAALALALGLSDEIQSTSGGISMDTLFIDEGFGSLDDKSLDKAMETLYGLSRGDCLIGIISHVSKLKEIISKRIVVERESDNNTSAKIEL